MMPDLEEPAKKPNGREKGQRNREDIKNANSLKVLTKDTRVAENLWLHVRGNSRIWMMLKMLDGKRWRKSLGPWPEVSLTAAKAKVAEYNAMLLRGEDPRRPVVKHRFREVVPLWIEKERPGWSNAQYAKAVAPEIARYTDAILGDLDVARIDTPDIEAVLTQLTDNDLPFWLDKHQTARRVRGYIESVLGYAMAKRWRTPGFNPATWKDNLEHLLIGTKAISKPEKHPSLHHTEIGEFMQVLRRMDGLRYRCLEVTILTGLRSNEAIGARWPEIDLTAGLWTVPGPRMKKRVDHTVPLCTQAVALLQSLPRTGDRVFENLESDALRDALADVMAEAGREWRDRKSGKVVVPHGFRASFSTWAGEQGMHNELIDVCLAHAVGTDVLRRYQRGDKAELRRVVMQQWADFLDA